MKRLILCLSLLFIAMPAFSETGFQFAAPGVRAPNDPNVDGFRLSILYGKNASVSGLDLGFFSFSETSKLSGFSAIFGVGRITGQSSGCASALVLLHTGEASGINAAFINRVHSMKTGVNLGFVNITEGASNVDVSGLGISGKSKVQLGFVNVTDEIEGVQIGFLNVAKNGFLPVFPFFNFPAK